jgi:hypothetical protein
MSLSVGTPVLKIHSPSHEPPRQLGVGMVRWQYSGIESWFEMSVDGAPGQYV